MNLFRRSEKILNKLKNTARRVMIVINLLVVKIMFNFVSQAFYEDSYVVIMLTK